MNTHDAVIKIISIYSGVDKDDFGPDNKLTEQPLNFDGNGLKYLAGALRSYVRAVTGDDSKTIKKKDIAKSGFTVEKTIELVEGKINA
jgi:hypothetical protein